MTFWLHLFLIVRFEGVVTMEKFRLAPGDSAPAWEVCDLTGTTHTLHGVQAQRPAILTLLRHFG